VTEQVTIAVLVDRVLGKSHQSSSTELTDARIAALVQP